MQQVGIDQNWMIPIIKFLEGGELPEDPKEARRIKIQDERFSIINGELNLNIYNLKSRKLTHINLQISGSHPLTIAHIQYVGGRI